MTRCMRCGTPWAKLPRATSRAPSRAAFRRPPEDWCPPSETLGAGHREVLLVALAALCLGLSASALQGTHVYLGNSFGQLIWRMLGMVQTGIHHQTAGFSLGFHEPGLHLGCPFSTKTKILGWKFVAGSGRGAQTWRWSFCTTPCRGWTASPGWISSRRRLPQLCRATLRRRCDGGATLRWRICVSSWKALQARRLRLAPPQSLMSSAQLGEAQLDAGLGTWRCAPCGSLWLEALTQRG